MKRLWIDTHIHISDLGHNGTRRERLADDLAELLDRCDADLRFVVSCDGPYLGWVKQSPEQMVAANQMVYEVTRRLPGRVFGACMVNANFRDAALDLMDRAFGEWGFVMLGEMLQYSHDYWMDSDDTEALVRRAVRWDVPVQVHLGTYWHKQHTGSTDGMDHLRDLLRANDRVPEAKWILAHAIGCGPRPEFVSWANMFLDTLAGVFTSYPRNFWVEIRDFQAPAVPRTLAEVPADRILAGTDWTTRIGPPFQNYGTMFDVAEDANPFPPCVESFVGFLRQGGANDETIEQIGSRNAIELMRLSV